MQLVSLQIGQPQERVSKIADGNEAVWTSGIFKNPVAERLSLTSVGLAGDGQADLVNHGGPDKAVCCYASEHYSKWRDILGWPGSDTGFPYGAFGENFTLAGMTEEAVCIGDIYAVGSARVQISQPRMPCYKLGRRWEKPELPRQVQVTGRTGYYLRVLEPGAVGREDILTLLERPLPQWTVTHINQAMYVKKEDDTLADELGKLPLLAEAWRRPFRRRAGLLRANARRKAES